MALATPEWVNAWTQQDSDKIRSTPKQLDNDYQVLHTTVGRIRIGITRVSYDQEYAKKLTYALTCVAFVNNVRINPMAKSVVINYEGGSHLETEIQESIFTAIQRADTLTLPPVEVLEELEQLEQQIASFWEWLHDEFKKLIKGTRKEVLQAIGMVSMILGIVGLLLPLIPGTPFILLAALCFETAALEQPV